MIISLKDGIKLFGIAVVSCCAVFVSTLFTNFYIDVLALADAVPPGQEALYEAQLAMAKLIPIISGAVLAVIAVIMLIFYIKLYIDENVKKIALMKAMGYPDGKIALSFWVFGLSVAVGAVIGYSLSFCFMPLVYEGMSIEGMKVADIGFHWELLLGYVIAPSVLFTLISVGYAVLALRAPVGEMLKGKSEKIKNYREREGKERGFLTEMCLKTLGAKKSLVFFVAFAGFCFSAMVQMSLSMENLQSGTMALMILVIGLVLAFVTLFMSVTALVKANVKNFSLMKAFGYSVTERTLSVFGGFVPFVLLGFGVGSVYQYVLLSIMVNLVFKDVGNVPEYCFDVPAFFITLAVFVALYAAVFVLYAYKMNKISVKEIMTE